jgi:hypothetical protein
MYIGYVILILLNMLLRTQYGNFTERCFTGNKYSVNTHRCTKMCIHVHIIQTYTVTTFFFRLCITLMRLLTTGYAHNKCTTCTDIRCVRPDTYLLFVYNMDAARSVYIPSCTVV